MEVKVQEKINKPLSEVFEGIADPQKLSSYFTTRASGRIEEGKTLIWSWADYNAELSVEIEKSSPINSLSLLGAPAELKPVLR